VASRLAKEADVILALGTRLGFNSTFYSYDNINVEAEIIQVELEPTAIGRHFPVSLGIWADARNTAQQLCTALEKITAQAEVADWTAKYRADRVDYLEKRDADAAVDVFPIQPSGLFKALRDVLPRNAAITMDAGTL
jgi:acetolactate synthase-1/2/3 large subunit/sulfoacetaldehyde acetyltransferase